MKDFIKSITRPKVRKYLYGVLLASLPVGVVYGWVDAADLPLYAGLGLAILHVNPED